MASRSVSNPIFPPEASRFAAIAATFKPRLSAYCGLDTRFVNLVANDRYKVTIDEPFFLYFQFFGIEAFGDTGGGRLNPWATRRLRVYVYTRIGSDIYGSDDTALMGPNAVPSPAEPTPELPVAQFQAEELVLGALFNWMPLSLVAPTTRPLLTEPVHPADGSGPPTRKDENDMGLVRTNLDFSIRWNLCIDRRDPPI